MSNTETSTDRHNHSFLDPLAVAAAFMPELFVDASNTAGPERYLVEVVTDGAHAASSSSPTEAQASKCGMTVASPASPAGSAGIRIPNGLDAEKVWQLIDDCLDLAERATR